MFRSASQIGEPALPIGISEDAKFISQLLAMHRIAGRLLYCVLN